jgi:threonine dehydratase
MAAIKLKKALKGKKVALQFSGCNASPVEISKAYSSRLFSEGWTID